MHRHRGFGAPSRTTGEMGMRPLGVVSWCSAADLLALSAFLAPDDIPLDLVVAGAELIPARLAAIATDPVALHRAVAAAGRLSLIECEDEVLSIHRLAASVVRDEQESARYGPPARRSWSMCSSGVPGPVNPRPPPLSSNRRAPGIRGDSGSANRR